MALENADPKKVDEMLAVLSKKLNIPAEQLRSELQAGKFDNAIKGMKPSEAAKFNQIVNNPRLMETFMSAPQTQALYKKLTGGK